MDKKELAKKSAIARSRQAPGGRPQGGQNVARAQSRQNMLGFYGEESTGLKLSPKTVLVISLLYLGIVVLLHIFGKIKSGDAKKEF